MAEIRIILEECDTKGHGEKDEESCQRALVVRQTPNSVTIACSLRQGDKLFITLPHKGDEAVDKMQAMVGAFGHYYDMHRPIP